MVSYNPMWVLIHIFERWSISSTTTTTAMATILLLLLLFIGTLSLLLGLGFDAERRVGHCPKALFGDEFACFAANTVGAIFDAHQRGLQVLDKFHLSLGQPACLFLGERGGTLFQHLVGGRGIDGVVAVGICHRGTIILVLLASHLQFFVDDCTKFGQLLV